MTDQMIKLKLRDYQQHGIELLRGSFRSGNKRIILHLATGGGKTATFTHMANSIFENGMKILIIIRRRQLILQTAKSFEKFTGHKTSVIMSSEKGLDPDNSVQVCSIDTICRRIDKEEYQFLKDFDFVFVDEAHDSTSPKYKAVLEHFMDKSWIGFTASPFPIGKKYLEDTGWQDVVCPIQAHELRDQGFLVPEVTYAPKKIDTTGIRIRNGDFDIRSLAVKASESKIVGDIVQTWIDYGQNRPTILFAVNKEHSAICAEAFRQRGIGALHQDESHNNKERESAIEKLKSGEIKILCNVNIFSTGVDIPQAACGIFARPTRSEILYVQQVGRLLRPYKRCSRCRADCGAEEICQRCGSNDFSFIKKDAILLDHANNCERFGLAYEPRSARITRDLEKKSVTNTEDIPKTKTCSSCFAVYEFNHLQCPYCDHENEAKKRMIKEQEGELVRIRQRDLKVSRLKGQLDALFAAELRKNRKESAKFVILYKDHGEEIFDYAKELEFPSWVKSTIRGLQRKGLLDFIKK